jgi:hypothetical protein
MEAAVAVPKLEERPTQAERYRALLEELLSEFEDRADTEDGSYDGPGPNWEMQMAFRIKQVLR